jgi:probable phosphoglycerate mutase
LGAHQAVSIDPALAEFDYGHFEGLTPAEIQSRAPGWSLWNDGCPGGEELVSVAARVDGFIERVRGRHAGETICVVSHGHLLRALAARLLELPVSEGRVFAIDTCAIGDFRVKNGRFLVAAWNRTR